MVIVRVEEQDCWYAPKRSFDLLVIPHLVSSRTSIPIPNEYPNGDASEAPLHHPDFYLRRCRLSVGLKHCYGECGIGCVNQKASSLFGCGSGTIFAAVRFQMDGRGSFIASVPCVAGLEVGDVYVDFFFPS